MPNPYTLNPILDTPGPMQGLNRLQLEESRVWHPPVEGACGLRNQHVSVLLQCRERVVAALRGYYTF